jgi:VWFA-related protein
VSGARFFAGQAFLRVPALLLAAALAASCQEQVVVDLVVRDSAERLVRDLKPAELEIREDGVPQTVQALRLVDASRQPRLVTVLFSGLGPGEGAYARDAARRFVATQVRPETYVGVFSLDDRLNILQPFTSDPALIDAALDRIAGADRLDLLRASLAIERSGQAGAANILPERLLAGNRLDLGLGPRAAAGGLFRLLHLFRAQASWPGSKTALCLSARGLPVDRMSDEIFRSLISTANRSGVTVYGLDVRRLANRMGELAETPILAPPTGLDAEAGLDYGEHGFSRLFRRQDDRPNPVESLRELAESTGGFLIQTAKPDAMLRRIAEETGARYEVSYTRASAREDGRFHAFSVKLARPGLTAGTRAGSYAVLPSEAGVFEALSARPLPNDFEYQSAAIRFRPGPGRVEYALVFEVPGIGVTVVEDKERNACRLHLSFAALVRGADGGLAETISGDIPYAAPLDSAAALRGGRITFGGSVSLPPGRYTLETAVIDRESRKASARRSVLAVPAAKADGVSELVLARRVDPLAWLSPDNPLESRVGKIVPALDGVVRAGASLVMYAAIYTGDPRLPGERQLVVRGAEGRPVRMELVREGRTVAAGKADLRAADGFGRMPLLAAFTSARLIPGRYELRAWFGEGASALEQVLAVTVR